MAAWRQGLSRCCTCSAPWPVAPLLPGASGDLGPPVHGEWRLAYCYDTDQFDHELIAELQVLEVDCVLSANRHLDVLPAGVNKGTTLTALRHFGFADLLD